MFLEVIEWFDDTGKELLRRIPESGSADIKYGAQLTVRESQACVFFYQGRAVAAFFGPGRHTLKTGNFPVLTKMASVPWGMKSPLRAETYFINLKVFTNLKWGTRDPVAFKDSELGLIRLRAFGVYNIRVAQPVHFLNSLAGTQGIYTTAEIEEYLSRVIVSRFNDQMGEALDSVLNLPARYDEISAGLAAKLADDFGRFGLKLVDLYINAITPPSEVQKAIDDRSRMGLFDDMNKLMRMKAAMAIEKAAESDGGEAMAAGAGVMMPAMFARFFQENAKDEKRGGAESPGLPCPKCDFVADADAKFCSQCGEKLVVATTCANCDAQLARGARFCSQCGHPTDATPGPKVCRECGAENLPNALFCNQCGERQ